MNNNMQNNSSQKSKIINTNANNDVKIQTFKKKVLDKATKELNKIEDDIKELEQNNKK